MPAELVTCGDVAVGIGGEFELLCARELRDNLPHGYVIATNVNIHRGGGEFYEYDVVVSAPGLCDVLELKCIRPDVIVYEDLICSETGFSVDRVFSKLDHKAKVLATRRQKAPFPSGSLHRNVRVRSQVVVPSDARLSFKIPIHDPKPVITLAEAIAKYKAIATGLPHLRDATLTRENLNGWKAFKDESARGQRKTSRHLGRFIIRRQIRRQNTVFEYFAVDEAPCQNEVQLREFPYDSALPSSELQAYLRQVARESRVLMKLRHPSIACVIGHFQTGASWVQVSDWFEGTRLEESWAVLSESTALDRLGIFLKLLQALQFCHEKGVFHRNVGADTVWVLTDLSDLRLVGFDCALDVGGTATANTAVLGNRDSRLIPPEDLQAGRTTNARLSDIFQVGVLLYRILEDGAWPFENTLDYVTSGGSIRPFCKGSDEPETRLLRVLSLRMMDVHPERRPDLLSKVEQELRAAIAAPN